jgi:hypothetical protein
MKSRVSLSLDEDLLYRIDAAAEAIGGNRSFVVSLLCRRGLGSLASEGGGIEVVSTSIPPPGAVIEILAAGIPHIAIAPTLAEAAEMARARGLKWAAGGRPHEIADMLPPVEATSAICTTAQLAAALIPAPNWYRCPPQLVRQGFTA